MGFTDLLFITYRIMPFIMVSFLVIISLFTSELSGFWILVGLLLSSILTIGVSKTQWITSNADITPEMLQRCNLITFGGHVLSNLPLSTHTFAFIFAYFMYVTMVNKIASNNLFLLIVLGGIMVIDVIFNFNNCAKHYVFVPLFIGALSGITWAGILGKENQMLPKSADSQASCKVNKNNVYNCKIKRSIVSA
jgi:hypothetical protein